MPFLFSLLLWVGLVAYLAWEHRSHVHSRERIPLRIHVNGTRGKSSVTRLIAAGLRAADLRVFAKTTGSSPRLIRPDGGEERWRRRGPANIRENLSFLRKAARGGADAVVVECMALRPDLQWALEHRILHSHVGVITNIRADHEDVMGEGVGAVAAALGQTIPGNGTLVAAPKSVAALREAGLLLPEPRLRLPAEQLPQEVLAAFPYEVFEENVALALAVCKLCGVGDDVALEGMKRAAPDEGNVCVRNVLMGNKAVRFINAFAANDPESTMLLWNRYRDENAKTTIVLLNTRTDRKYRTVQLCRALGAIPQSLFLVTGDASLVRRHVRSFADLEVVTSGPKDCFEVLQKTVAEAGGASVQVFATGNRQGMEPLLTGIAALEKVSGE